MTKNNNDIYIYILCIVGVLFIVIGAILLSIVRKHNDKPNQYKKLPSYKAAIACIVIGIMLIIIPIVGPIVGPYATDMMWNIKNGNYGKNRII